MKYCSGKWIHTSSRGGFLLTPCRACFSSITKAAALSGSLVAQRGGSAASAPQPAADATYSECPTTSKTVLQVSFCYTVSCWLQLCKAQILSTEGSRAEVQWWMPEDVFFWQKSYDMHRWTPCPKPSTNRVQVCLGSQSLLKQNQAHPRSCSNGKEQTSKEHNKAFMNRQSGAAQERNISLVSILGILAISSVTGQICQHLTLL